MKIAVITGANTELGREFAVQISRHFSKIEEIWLIDSHIDKLKDIEKLIHNKKIRKISLDFSYDESYKIYKKLLQDSEARIKILINAADYGRNIEFERSSYQQQEDLININCKSKIIITKISIPYMYFKSYILNLSFFAMPKISSYSAANIMILNFSKRLDKELKSRGIRVCAVCSGFGAGEFCSTDKNKIGFNYNNFNTTEKKVKKALFDAVIFHKELSANILDRIIMIISNVIN